MVVTVEPSFDQRVAERRRSRFALHELLELAMHVEIVEEKSGAPFEHPRHLAHDLLVLVFGREVAEAREEIDETSEAVAAERKVAHVGTHDWRRVVFTASG